jgi:membrane protein DedA with SNARE-associated domain
MVERISKYLLASSVGLAALGAALAWYGFHFIDVPEPAFWLFPLGLLLLIVAVLLTVAVAVLGVIKRVRP